MRSTIRYQNPCRRQHNVRPTNRPQTEFKLVHKICSQLTRYRRSYHLSNSLSTPASSLQPTQTPTLRLSANTMSLEPLHRMIRMIPMPTGDAKAQKLTHSTLHLRQLPLTRPLLRIVIPKPKRTNSAARHVASALGANSP